MKIKIEEQEFWYGGCAAWGIEMPLGADAEKTLVFSPNQTPNQAMPLLVSSKGRYLWLDGCTKVDFCGASIVCEDSAQLRQSGNTLKTAYQQAANRYFAAEGAMPAEPLFGAPIFNTWIELTFYQNQQAVLDYAQGILNSGFEPGVLMIDDGWAENYGCWRFHSGRFPHPEQMLKKLHEMGFRVMLWVCPYVTADGIAYRQAHDRGLLLQKQDGSPFIADWWNGYSAALDLSLPKACEWLDTQLHELMRLGVDGFKFDGGDAMHYVGAYSEQQPVEPNEMCRLWGRFGKKYPFNEYRAAWNAAGTPLLQRLCDKDHSWGKNGMQALIPDTLAQGITGHPFGCADMVGGGEYRNFAQNAENLDRELFVKHAAVSCLMPAIQFSAAPWRILTQADMEIIHSQMRLRKQVQPYLETVLRQSAKSGEPAVRYMEYEFPHEGCEKIMDQFMLGTELLVAPILEKGKTGRMVYLPKGTWRWQNEILQSRGEEHWFSQPDSYVILLEKQKA